MKQRVIQSISRYVEMTEDLEYALSEASFVMEFPKGTVLLENGQICSECFFILDGLIRSYYLQDGEEITTDFFKEDQVVSPSCYGMDVPSKIGLDCLEDTIACVGTPQMEEEMFQKYPQLISMAQIMGEKIMSSYQERFDSFKLHSPEQRYLNLIKNEPDLIQRVPQYQLASYLGIKPESLSRIRKRITISR